MKVADIASALHCTELTSGDQNAVIGGGYTSDLLSDVMGNAAAGDVLITIQGHKNTVAVANLVGIPAVVLCNGRTAPADMRALAEQEGIALFGTDANQFTVSHLLAAALEAE